LEKDHQVEWLNTQEQGAWLAFLRAQKLLFEELDRDLRARTGITLDDYDVLARLSMTPSRRMRMSELAEIVVMPKSRLTYRVDQLVKRGFVSRVDSEEDKRGIFAELTDEGIAAIEAAAPVHVQGVRALFVENCQPERLSELEQCFTQISEGAAKTRDSRGR
jgi:DNA-binding MarR family transcriptional regulator